MSSTTPRITSMVDNEPKSPKRPTSTSALVPSHTNRNSSVPTGSVMNAGYVTPKRSQSADPTRLRTFSSGSSTSSKSSIRRDSSSTSINEMHMDNKLFDKHDQKKLFGGGNQNHRNSTTKKDRTSSVEKKKINEERSKKKGKLQRQTSFDAKQARLERNQYSAPSAIRSNSWGLGESLEDTVSSDRNSIDAKIKGLTEDSLKSGSLDLTRMKLKSFPTKIVENVIINKTNDIHKIQEISLYKNQLQNLPNKFYDLFKDNLVELHINDNVFVTVPDSLKQFVALEKLNVSNNRIKEFPKHLVNLSNLRELNLSKNQLKEFPKNFNFPSSLQVLNLGKNALKEIPRAIFQLEQLTKLDLSNNFIIDIPPGIEQMKELIHLNLKCNKIEELAADIFNCDNKLTKLKTLLVIGNPLYMPPRSVLKKWPNKEALRAVRDFFKKQGRSTANRTHFKRTSKAIFLGGQSSGKTSCVNLLLNNRQNQANVTNSDNNNEKINNNEMSNIGIEISELSMPTSDGEITLEHKVVLWDTVTSSNDYKATHKLLLNSSRALYIVVFDFNKFRNMPSGDRKNWDEKEQDEWQLLVDTNISDWVQSVHNHVPDARILLCGTHIDNLPHKRRDKIKTCVRETLLEKALARNTILKIRLEKINSLNLPSLNPMIRKIERIYKTSLRWQQTLIDEDIIKLSMSKNAEEKTIQSNRKILQSRISKICDALLKKEKRKMVRNKVPTMYLDVRDLIFEECARRPFFTVGDIVDKLYTKYEEDEADDDANDVDEEIVINALEFLNDRSDIIFFKDVQLVFVNVSWIVLLVNSLVNHTENRETFDLTTEDLFQSWNKILSITDDQKQESDGGDQLEIDEDMLDRMNCVYTLMQQCGILFHCNEGDKCLLLCKIPYLDTNNEEQTKQLTKRFQYPLENDIEVSRFVHFENGYSPEGLIHVIQARWMEFSNDETGLPEETDPYFADAAILHSNDNIQIYLRFGNTKGSGSMMTGRVLSQMSDTEKERYHNFVGIYVRHSDMQGVDNNERENPLKLHKYCDVVLRIILSILTSNYPGLIATVQLPCPMCARTCTNISQATRLDVLDIYNKEEGHIMCEKCVADKLSGNSFGIPRQQTIPMDYYDAGDEDNINDGNESGLASHTISARRTIVQSPSPAVVSIGLVNLKVGINTIVEVGSGVCLDAVNGIFLTAAHIVFKAVDKLVGHETRVEDFEDIQVYIGLFQGEKNSPKWAFLSDKMFLKKVMEERKQRNITDDILILRAIKKFRYLRSSSYGSTEGTEDSNREYISPSITNAAPFNNAKSIQESLQVTMASLDRVELSGIGQEITIVGYPGIPQVGTTAVLHNGTGQGKICSSKCIVEDVDDHYFYALDVKHQEGSSGGPALVKTANGSKYAVAGIIVGKKGTSAFMVPQEKCEWMLNLLHDDIN